MSALLSPLVSVLSNIYYYIHFAGILQPANPLCFDSDQDTNTQSPKHEYDKYILLYRKRYKIRSSISMFSGHSGAMTLTELVYTHLDVHELVEAINLI